MNPSTIAHFDADAFFASVEQAADRHLREKPVAVGSLHRGIVASASYEARRYGVYTPMPMTQARRLCPPLIVVPPHFELYEQFSTHIFGLTEELTPLVEKQGVDEGYFDLSGTQRCLRRDPDDIADTLRRTIKDWLKVTISLGLARTKLLSQIASKLNKPDRLTVIPPDYVRELQFLHPLAVKWLPGIGPVGSRLFASAGITRIGQVAHLPVNWLAELVGRQARQLREFANNIDERSVQSTTPDALSYGHQETFDSDTADAVLIEAVLRRLADHALQRVRADRKQIRTVTVKIRYTDMYEKQGQLSLAEPTDFEDDVYPLVSQLLRRLWDRRVRLRMVHIKLSRVYSACRQLDLFGRVRQKQDLSCAVDAVRQRFGTRALMRAHDLTVQEFRSLGI